jgi:riboflavin biosynthesis pyrimidine reductase
VTGLLARPVRGSDPLPSRAAPRGAEALELLFEIAGDPTGPIRGGLVPGLAAVYGGELSIPLRADRPAVVANFVETVDGVVAFDPAGMTGGGDVSGFSPTDRFVMGLLRALSDVVLVGASALRSRRRRAWTPESGAPAFRDDFAELRERLGLQPSPRLLVVTASGDVDPRHPVFTDGEQRVTVAAPGAAADRLTRARLGANASVERLAGRGPEAIAGVVDVAARDGARLVVSEAGPTVFGGLLAAHLVDELFLTVAPQLAGRADGAPRRSLVEGVRLWPDDARWARLVSGRRAGDHLFLRYRFEETD